MAERHAKKAERTTGNLHDVARRIAAAETLEELESIRQELDAECVDIIRRTKALEEAFLRGGPRVQRGPRRGQLTAISHRRHLIGELFGKGMRFSMVTELHHACYRRAVRLGAKLTPEAVLMGDPIVCTEGAAQAEVAWWRPSAPIASTPDARSSRWNSTARSASSFPRSFQFARGELLVTKGTRKGQPIEPTTPGTRAVAAKAHPLRRLHPTPNSRERAP